jgi:hypothetical protein
MYEPTASKPVKAQQVKLQGIAARPAGGKSDLGAIGSVCQPRPTSSVITSKNMGLRKLKSS